MMSDALNLGAAVLLGLVASGHCVVMCGGISAALGLATAKDRNGRPRALLLIGYQLGRIGSYALAGLLFAGILGGAIAMLDIEAVRAALRVLSSLALVIAAFVAFGRARDPGAGIGRRIWTKLAPLGRRLFPVSNFPRAVAFGMIWGWMPCGFAYTVLLIATLRLDALDGALTMTAFGLGTAPALLMTAFGAQRFSAFAARTGARHAAGSLLLASAMLTLIGPWLAHLLPGLHGWLPFDCRPHP